MDKILRLLLLYFLFLFLFFSFFFSSSNSSTSSLVRFQSMCISFAQQGHNTCDVNCLASHHPIMTKVSSKLISKSKKYAHCFQREKRWRQRVSISKLQHSGLSERSWKRNRELMWKKEETRTTTDFTEEEKEEEEEKRRKVFPGGIRRFGKLLKAGAAIFSSRKAQLSDLTCRHLYAKLSETFKKNIRQVPIAYRFIAAYSKYYPICHSKYYPILYSIVYYANQIHFGSTSTTPLGLINFQNDASWTYKI